MVKLNDKMTESHLPEVCNVHLLYMGNYVFAELKRKPYSKPNPRSMVADPALQIQAMKKSVNTENPDPLNLSGNVQTITSTISMSNSAAMISTNNPQESCTISTNMLASSSNTLGTNTGETDKESGHMYSIDTSTVPSYGQPVFPTVKQILPLHPHLSADEEGSSNSSTTPTNEDSEDSNATIIDTEDITLMNPSIDTVIKTPPEKLNRECHVQLSKLTEDEINVWTKTETLPEFPEFVKSREVGGYNMQAKTPLPRPRLNTRPRRGQYLLSYKDLNIEPEPTSPKKPKCRHIPVPKDGLSAERIAAHRFRLRSTSKLVIDLDIEKTENTGDQTETGEKEAASPAKHTPALSQKSPVTRKVLTELKPKGELIVTTHGVIAHSTRKRRFKCPDCDLVKSSRKLLNVHFKSSHNKLLCEECRQMFSTPSALDRHMYIHNKEDQHQCNCCDETFPFPSDLKIHMIKHLKEPGFQCGHGKCQKWFKRKGERDKHAHTHTALDITCDQCDYITKDIRHLRRHKMSHSDIKKLSCGNCGRMFKWHME